MENVNLQLYSFGFDCPLSLLEKIKAAGEMGYSGVEFARGYEEIPVEEVQKALDEAGVRQSPPMWRSTSWSRTCPIWPSWA